MTTSREKDLYQTHEAAAQGPLFIVLNAHSGSNDAEDVQQAITRVLTEAGRQHEFFLVTELHGIADMARQAVARAVEQRGVVVAVGGDGTLNAVAHAVLGSGCPFGVLPQGTFNYFGRVHGIPQEAAAATRALLRARVAPVQVGRVNQQLFLVNASLGLYPKLLEDREEFEKQYGRGRLISILAGLVTIFKWHGQLRLSAEDADRTGKEIAALRTTTLFIGNNRLQLDRVGIDPKHTQGVEEGFLVAIAVRPIRSWALVSLLLRGMVGRLAEAENVNSFSFRRLTVNPRGLRRIKVAMDGEVQWMKTPLVFEVAPDPLLLLVPSPDERAEIT